jgi:hypothetical protein
MSVNSEPRPSATPVLMRVVVLSIAAAGLIYALLTYGGALSWADQTAFLVAFMCVASAVRLMLESFNRRSLGALMRVEDAATSKEVAQARLQAVLLLALGGVIVWPPIAALMAWPAPLWTYGVVVAFLAVRIVYTIYVFRRGDEFARQRVRHVTWWTYFAGQTALLAYAAAERLGLAPTVTAWDILVLLVGLSIVMSAFVSPTKPTA